MRAAELFRDVDILLAPATPCPATEIGSEWVEINGQHLPTRANMGVLTQPISCIGLPVCAVPVWGCHASLPIGESAAGASAIVSDGSAAPRNALAVFARPRDNTVPMSREHLYPASPRPS